MMWSVLFFLFFLASPVGAASPLRWSDAQGELVTTQGIIMFRATADAITGAPDSGSVHLEGQADFDGDGVEDAVVTISGGGNCCPSGVYFVTLRDEKFVPARIGDTWPDFRSSGHTPERRPAWWRGFRAGDRQIA